ncbi:PhnE/PtxC family ABC transporter permease [Marivivens aquimaris]|uniref:PhnE/PtxC family ABC transporter permease n=1 Tax=Marivivens aquimaris TaxID=2774876 RepID=UPI00188238B4|nr:ABC transporter permease [Marivivens aquimaris]
MISSRRVVLLGFIAAAIVALGFADLTGRHTDPSVLLARMADGLLHPDFSIWPELFNGTMLTAAFAVCGVFFGAGFGLLLAPLYHIRTVRTFCIAIRAIHELFWALLLLNITGLSPTTGVLAIGIPYTGIFAKVFSEYLDEASRAPEAALPRKVGQITRLLWARLPQCVVPMRNYTLYRLECGIRSSAVLGFIGLPTLGYLLETYFKQAHYDQAFAVLAIFLLLIIPVRRWMKWRLAPIYLLASLAVLVAQKTPPMGSGMFARFLHDIIPAPIRTGAEWSGWLEKVFVNQAWPGVVDTVVLSQIALTGAALIAFFAFPAIVPRVAGRFGAMIGHLGLVLCRSLPEYMLAFVLLQFFGPSMLPAILALALHNGAIIAHLLGRQATSLALRPDAPTGLTLWGWELVPRLSANFWALCLYRWEIIVRESAIMGILGIGTLGFYIQKNVQELRLDRVVALLAVSFLLTMAIDQLSRRLRASMRVGTQLHIEGSRGNARR